ncbi:MAG TPA: hypothetical protein VFT22_12905 [Kofleriaceae bacterium]|nr:hypothetical protein [Kofleriaceae bacterium]
MTPASSRSDTVAQAQDSTCPVEPIRNPFPGPQPYRAADRAVFFGRESDATRFERHVLANPCTTLFGPSGSGKSSLVQAAVEPGLHDRFGYCVVHIDSWRLDQPPIRSFVQALCTAVGQPAPEPTVDPLAAIGEVIARALDMNQRLFIFLDQLERLLYANRAHAELLALLEAIDRIVQHPSPDLHVVLAVREDYLGRFRDRARRYRMLLENSFRLGPLSVGAMTKAVCKAAAQGMPPQSWPDNEVGELLLQMRLEGQPPGPDAEVHGAFVQIVCRALWEQRRVHGATQPLSSSNPAEIVDDHLKTTLGELGAYSEAAQRLLEDKLVDEHHNRTLLTEKEATAALPPGAADEVLKKLESAAVLRAEAYEDGRFFQLGHDWLATQISMRRQQREAAAQADREAREAAAQADRERLRKRRRTWTEVGAAAATIAAAAWLAWTQIERSQEQLRRRHDALLTDALNVATSEPIHGMQLALEVQHDEKVLRPYTEANLRKALRTSRFRGLLIASHGLFADARFLPDGKRVVTIGDADGLALWDIATGKRLRAMYGDPSPTVLAIDSEGRRAATAGALGAIAVWDLEQQQLLRTLRGHLGKVTAMAFNQDGSLLASASADGSAIVWDMRTGRLRHQLIDHLGSVAGLAFSPDGGRLVTIGDDQRTILWDARRGKKLEELARQVGEPGVVAFSPTGRYLGITSGSTVTLRDPITQALDGTLSHNNVVVGIAFSPDGDRIASVGFDGTLRIWSTATRAELSRLIEEPGLHDRQATMDRQPRLTQQLTVAFSADGRQLVTVGFDGTAKLWATDGGGEIDAFQAHTERIREIEYSPRGDRMATASADGTVAIWDGRGHLIFRTPRAIDVRAIAFDPLGARLVASEGRRIVVWNLGSGSPTRTVLRDESAEIRDLRIYPHAEHDRIAVVIDGHVIVRNLDDGREIFSLDVAPDAAAVAIRPDHLAIASECGANPQKFQTDRRLCVWSAEDGKPIATLDPGPGRNHWLQVLALAFSPDGTRLYSSSTDQSIKVWDTEANRLLASLSGGHHESILGLAASRNGEWLASVGDDHLRLWGVRNQAAEVRFPDAEPGAGSVAFSPDGKYVSTGGSDGVVRTYALDPEALVSAARLWPPFALSNRDCGKFTQRSCQAKPTSLQIMNGFRWTLRTLAMEGGVNPAIASYMDDGARFETAQRIHRALTTVRIEPKDLLRANSPAKDRPGLAGAIAATLDDKRKQAEGDLAGISQSDREAIIDPARFTTSVAEQYLIELARMFAAKGNVEVTGNLLGLIPGITPDRGSLQELAGTTATAMTISSFRQNLRDGKAKESFAAIRSTKVPPVDDPRFNVFVRVAGFAALAADRPEDAVQLAESALRRVDDPSTLIDLGDILTQGKRYNEAESAYRRAVSNDPMKGTMNDTALLHLGVLLATEGQADETLGHEQAAGAAYKAAVTTLQSISPWSPEYKPAVHLVGPLLYDKLKRPEEGYRVMASALDSPDTGDWANVAEAAWANGKLLEARLIAERVLDARAVAPAKLSYQLAMHFVRLAALAQAREFRAANRELDALVQFVTDAENQRVLERDKDWSYVGSRDVVTQLPAGPLKDFVAALLAYVEHLGGEGSPEQLRALLQQLARPARPSPERARPVEPGPAAPAPAVTREVTAKR